MDMKKKIIILLLSAAMAFGAVGCSKELSNEYVTVKQYKDLEVPQVETAEVTDEYVEQTIQNNLNAFMEKENITDRTTKTGDWVNIDYVGSIDGEEFEGGADTGFDLELGSNSFIGATEDYKGFEEQLEGHKAGDEFDITVQFPEEYSVDPSKAGVVANFHIVINEAYTQTVPELTDDWVKENSEESKTVEEYREEIRKGLEESSAESAQSELQTEIQTALYEQLEVSGYPEGEVEDQVQQATDYYTAVAGMYGLELGDFITTYLQTTEDDFNVQLEDAAEKTVAVNEALKLIAQEEGLEPTEEEYEKRMAEYAEQAGMDDVEEYKEQVGEDVLREAVLRDVVTEYLVENCIQVEQSDDSE